MGRTAVTSTADVLDHHCAVGCSIALPQFPSVGSVVGSEIEGVADGCEVGIRINKGERSAGADHHCAIGCSIALPQHVEEGSVGGFEIEGVANGFEIVRITVATSAVDVHHHRA